MYLNLELRSHRIMYIGVQINCYQRTRHNYLFMNLMDYILVVQMYIDTNSRFIY